MLFFHVETAEMEVDGNDGINEIFGQMKDLENESLPTPPPTPATNTAGQSSVLIEGLDPPPTFTFNERQSTATEVDRQRTNRTNISNHPRRTINQYRNMNNPRNPNHGRRCLLHLAMRCPICFNRARNPRIFRQDGIRAILDLIYEVFGVRLNPRELSLFIAGYYA